MNESMEVKMFDEYQYDENDPDQIREQIKLHNRKIDMLKL